MFGRGKVDGEATIKGSREVKRSGDGLVSIHEFLAEVRAPGIEPFETVIQEPRIATNFWAPPNGAVVRVHVDPRKQTARFDKDDPQLDARAQVERQRSTWS